MWLVKLWHNHIYCKQGFSWMLQPQEVAAYLELVKTEALHQAMDPACAASLGEQLMSAGLAICIVEICGKRFARLDDYVCEGSPPVDSAFLSARMSSLASRMDRNT